MNISTKSLRTKSFISRFVFILLILQPILDAVSFWAEKYSLTSITTLVRFALLAAIIIYAFTITNRKKTYVIFCGACALYFIFHMIACVISRSGYISPVSDIANFIRTVQMPVLTLCFITFFNNSSEVPQKIQLAFTVNFILMLQITALSYITGTQVYTYELQDVGLIGWVFSHNAQSAILALIVPLTLFFVYTKKNRLLFYVTVTACFTNLFLCGTKLDYFSIFIIAAAILLFLIINDRKNITAILSVAVTAAICLASWATSPAYHVKATHDDVVNSRQEYIDKLNKEEVYELYLKPMVDRFGFERVAAEYQNTTDMYDLTDVRRSKLIFAKLAFEDSSPMSKLFGYEYKTLYATDSAGSTITFDPENDFHAVFYYSGYVGFALYIAFILYFIYLIFKALIKDPKKVFSLEGGLVITTLILILLAGQFSGNVLRRPNVTIYLSIILAYVYYLFYKKKEDKPEI